MKIIATIFLIPLFAFYGSLESFAENETIIFPKYVDYDRKARYKTGRDLRAQLLEIMPVGTAMEKVEEVIKQNGGNEYFSDYSIYSKKGWAKSSPMSEWPEYRKSIHKNEGEIVSITDYGLTRVQELNSKESVEKKTYQVKYRHKHSRKYMAKSWTILVQYMDGKVLDIHTKFNPSIK